MGKHFVKTGEKNSHGRETYREKSTGKIVTEKYINRTTNKHSQAKDNENRMNVHDKHSVKTGDFRTFGYSDDYWQD